MRRAGKRWTLVLMGALALAADAQISTTPLTFAGMTSVGANSQPVIVTLTAQSNGTLTSLAALTGGSPNLDFSVTPLTCTVNLSLTSGETCTVSAVFGPRFPGIRQGAVIAQAGNQVLASTPLSGVGQGSLPVLVPGAINTVAGDGDWIYQRDGIPATQAPIFLPSAVAVDAGGNLFLCDSSNNRVRRVDAQTGNISTVAGDGSPGTAGDGGPATSAQLSNPSGIAIDGAGNLFIADSGNNAVRRIDALSGLITTFAGQLGVIGYTGDGGAATSALLASPRGLALMPGGDLLIADSANNAVRLVSILNYQIQTIAGTGVAGYNQDGVAATLAQLNNPYGVAVRSDGAVAIADLENQRVRLVTPAGIISTVAGTGQRNAGNPQEQQLDGPADVAFDPAGDLFIADAGNNRVRVIYAVTGAIQTLAGTGSEQFAGDGGPANQASIYGPYALFFDAAGNLWLTDTFHNRVREITGSLLSLTYATIKVGNVSPPIVGMLYNQGNADLLLGAPVLTQAALDSATTTCNQTAMAPVASCNMGVEFAPTQVGANITGSIHWPSNAPNVTPIDSLNGQVLSVDVTSVALSSSANPALVGHPITLTATVTSADQGRTGTVTFSEGGTLWCSAVTLNGAGSAACVIPSLSLGSHSITAAYSGDTNNAPSTSPAYVEIIKQQAALVLNVAPDPAVVTSSVTLTLTAVDASGTPTGSVTMFDGTTPLATVVLSNSGIAQWSNQSFSVGSHALSAQYAGDSANMSGTSNTVHEVINKATTATALATSAANTSIGASVTFTATVTNSSGPSPTGSVTFKDGATVLGSASLTAGLASIAVTTLTPGTHFITAAYGGDTDNAASNSASVTETIAQIATVTTVSTDANPLNAGATLHVTANVSLAPNAIAYGALTGSVTFRDGSNVLGVVVLNSSGQAQLSVSTLNVGPHSLTAGFGGNANYAPSSSSALSQTVQKTATQTAVNSLSSSTLAGKPATFNVVVTSATGIPSGVVNLRDGVTVIGTVPLTGTGTASLTTTALAPGSHAITAVYGGDNNYNASTSSALQQLVQLAQPTLALNGPSSAVDAGTAANFSAALATPGFAPTGTLVLLNGNSPVSIDTVAGSGNFAFSTTTLSIGTHTLTATYSGDIDNSAITSQSLTVVVRQAGSVMVLMTSANPLTQGSPLTLTAKLTSDSPNAAGPVQFLDGATLLATITLAANGTATFSPPALALGSHILTAMYGGDTNHAPATSAPVTELVVERSSATLTSNDNPAASGQSVTFTAQIVATGHAVPTGSAVFRDNGALLGAVTLDGTGGASLTTNTLTVGTHTVSMSYSGDQNVATAFTQIMQTVSEASTQMALTASANPATFAQPISLVATIASNGATATGSVSFLDAGTAIGAATLNGSGVAVLTLTTIAPGAHTLVAQYAGDGKADACISLAIALFVKQTTSLAVRSNLNPGLTLNPVTFTAKLTNAGARAATGTIAVTDGGVALGTAVVDGTGKATLTLPAMAAGVHAIVASYAGDDADFAAISATYNETIQLQPTATSVTGSATDPANPQRITLIAVVEGQASQMPTGTVTFTSGSQALGQAPVGVTGVATITVVFAQPSQPVSASYSGDVNFAASQSTATISVTAAAVAQFTLWVSAPAVTLVTHQHATITINLGSVKGFTDTIALGCLGLPASGTCTFTPSQMVLPANGTVTGSLYLDTGNPLGAGPSTSAASANQDKGSNGRGLYLCWLPLGLLAGLLRRKQGSNPWSLPGVALLLATGLVAAMALPGCGGLSTAGTPPGTYTIQVVGTGQTSGTNQRQTITLVVTQ